MFKELFVESSYQTEVKVPQGSFGRIRFMKGNATVNMMFTSEDYEKIYFSTDRYTPEDKALLEEVSKFYKVKPNKQIPSSKAVKILNELPDGKYFVQRLMGGKHHLKGGMTVLGVFDKVLGTAANQKFKKFEDVVVKALKGKVEYSGNIYTSTFTIRRSQWSSAIKFSDLDVYQVFRADALKAFNTINSSSSSFDIYNHPQQRGFDWDYVLSKLSKKAGNELRQFLNDQFDNDRKFTRNKIQG